MWVVKWRRRRGVARGVGAASPHRGQGAVSREVLEEATHRAGREARVGHLMALLLGRDHQREGLVLLGLEAAVGRRLARGDHAAHGGHVAVEEPVGGLVERGAEVVEVEGVFATWVGREVEGAVGVGDAVDPGHLRGHAVGHLL